MACIWATSLELTWGVLQLRMIIKSMKEWVYDNVKPLIAQQIGKLCEESQRSTHTPEWDSIQQARRAQSTAPRRFRNHTPHLEPPITPPRFSRGMTNPESVNRGRSRRPVPTIPRIWLNDEGDLSDESWDSDGTYVNEAEKDKVNRPGTAWPMN